MACIKGCQANTRAFKKAVMCLQEEEKLETEWLHKKVVKSIKCI